MIRVEARKGGAWGATGAHACRAGAWARVTEVYSRLMRDCADSGRVRPNVITFNTMISAAGRAGEWEKALELYEEMDEHGVLPDKVRPTARRARGMWTPCASARRCCPVLY